MIRVAIQIWLAMRFKNLYIWIATEFLFSVIGCIVLNWKINKEYPWLKTDIKKGKLLLKRYPSIISNTRQIFIHKIKDFILNKSDELFVFAFVSLKMVAYYGNYTMIVSKVGQVFSSILDSTYAGVGNLVAEGNKQNTMKVFWELMTIRHFVAGLLCFSIYHFIEPFIAIWLGPEYILNREILLLLCIHIYISTSRGVVDMFNHSHGLYADIWSAWTELGINIVITVIAGYYWGIFGILLGKIASTSIIIVLWKPYYLYNSGFHENNLSYWKGAICNYGVSISSIIIAHIIIKHIFEMSAYTSYLSFAIFCIGGLTIYLSINILLTVFLCKGAKDCYYRIKQIMNTQKGNN